MSKKLSREELIDLLHRTKRGHCWCGGVIGHGSFCQQLQGVMKDEGIEMDIPTIPQTLGSF